MTPSWVRRPGGNPTQSRWVPARRCRPFHPFLHKSQVLCCLAVLLVQGVQAGPVFLELQLDPSVLQAQAGRGSPGSQPSQALRVPPCICRAPRWTAHRARLSVLWVLAAREGHGSPGGRRVPAGLRLLWFRCSRRGRGALGGRLGRGVREFHRLQGIQKRLSLPRLLSVLWSRVSPARPCHLCGLAVLGTPAGLGARCTPGGPPAQAGPVLPSRGSTGSPRCSLSLRTARQTSSRPPRRSGPEAPRSQPPAAATAAGQGWTPSTGVCPYSRSRRSGLRAVSPALEGERQSRLSRGWGGSILAASLLPQDAGKRGAPPHPCRGDREPPRDRTGEGGASHLGPAGRRLAAAAR